MTFPVALLLIFGTWALTNALAYVTLPRLRSERALMAGLTAHLCLGASGSIIAVMAVQ